MDVIEAQVCVDDLNCHPLNACTSSTQIDTWLYAAMGEVGLRVRLGMGSCMSRVKCSTVVTNAHGMKSGRKGPSMNTRSHM
eukprot:5768735-Amphidinium_carterae.1